MPYKKLLLGLLCSALIAAPPQRIISLAPNITETICYLGGTPYLVGATQECNYPTVVKSLPKVGNYTNPNLEKIIALQPDMVVTEKSTRGSFLSKLRKLGINYYLTDFHSLPDFYREVFKLQRALRLDSHQPLKRLKARLQQLEVTKQPKKTQSFIIILDKSPLIAAGSNTFLSQYLELRGYRNKVTAKSYPIINREFLLLNRPDIIINFSGRTLSLPYRSNQPRLIANLNPDLYLRLSPRLIFKEPTL